MEALQLSFSIKYNLALNTTGVYSLIKTRDKEYCLHICLYHPEKSAVTEHSSGLGGPLDTGTDHCYSGEKSWKPDICDLKEWRQSHTKD
jgi:hypothetical protein